MKGCCQHYKVLVTQHGEVQEICCTSFCLQLTNTVLYTPNVCWKSRPQLTCFYPQKITKQLKIQFYKIWTHTSPKKIHKWQISILSTLLALQNCKGNQQWDTTTRLYNCKNTKYSSYQMVARIYSNRNSHSLLVSMRNATTTREDNLAISYQIKSTLAIQSCNHTSW